MHRIGTVAAVTAAALLLFDGGLVVAAPPVDQHQSDTSGGTAGFCEESMGETFIANVSGTLTHLAVAIARSTIGDPGDLVFRIRSVDDDGLPTATIIGSATASNASIAVGETTWLQLGVEPTPKVVAGWWYAITTDAPDCDQPGDSGFGWAIGDGDAYPRGTALYATTSSGPWTRDWGRDYAFRTRVRPSSPVLQPDIMVAPGSGGPWIGPNLYDADGYTERIEAPVTAGSPATYRIRIENDGTRTDTFVIEGARPAGGFGVRYLKGRTGTTGISAKVTAGTYRVGPLAPGASAYLRVVVTPGAALASGATYKVAMRAGSVTRTRHVDGIHVFLQVD